MNLLNTSTEKLIYQERITSSWTTALFVFLTTVFLGLFIWRVTSFKLDLLAGFSLFFSCSSCFM